MRLFDEIHRTNEGPAGYAEPEFTYLNRSARVAASSVRQVLDAWFSRYPVADRAALRGRLRSTKDPQHRSAFFELFLHELLLRLECRVEIHPSVDDATTRRLDFLVECACGSRFYVEALVATGESTEGAAERARMSDVYDALNRLESPNFFIGVKLRGAPRTPPPARQIRSFLADRLAALDPDEMAKVLRSGGLDALPHWHYEHEGWKMDFFPIPKSPDARGKPGVRPLGMQFYEPVWMDSRIAIRDAIGRKAGRYGDLDLPYVVAVNALVEGVDEIDIADALFGKEKFIVSFAQSGPSRVEMTRVPDGVWGSQSSPRYRRITAVLVTAPLLPWNVPRASICLYHNPWAERPYSSELTRLLQAVLEAGRVKRVGGESLAVVLGLPSGWPEA